jgi:two-component system nitrate/nitrite response regulator NarL
MIVETARLNLLIVDDHPLVAGGIGAMLQDVDFLQIAGSCKNAAEALQHIQNSMPDIILLDIGLPDIDGLQLCSLIRQQSKSVKIIGLTSTNEAAIIAGFLQRGGNGYLLKNMERSELLDAINAVIEDRIYLSKASNEKILESFQNVKAAVDKVPVITRRENEIILLLADGLTGPQIAEKLFLSNFTVETHRKNLLKKFGVNNVQLLLKMAREYKLIS